MKLKQLRQEAHLTQAELAKKLNVGQGTLSNWENGNRTPDADTLKRIASFFNISIDYLLGLTNNTHGTVQEDKDFIETWQKGLFDPTDQDIEIHEKLYPDIEKPLSECILQIIYNKIAFIAFQMQLANVNDLDTLSEQKITLKNGKEITAHNYNKGMKRITMQAIDTAESQQNCLFLKKCLEVVFGALEDINM